MKKVFSIFLALMLFCILVAMSGCTTLEYAESGQVIISAKELASYVDDENTVILDARNVESYTTGHISGAVSLPTSEVLLSLPVDNTLASKSKVERVLSAAGIDNNTQVIIYDEGNSMNASRLWWTMLVYGHDNAKVVSGGIPAINEAGYSLTTEFPEITPREFVAEDRRDQYVVDMKTVLEQVNNPDANVVLLENRTWEEYAAEGKIPGSVLYTHTNNFYRDGTFLNVQATRINYIEQGIRPETEVIMYCRTSMRSSTSFILLYNAGYRNLKMYDGAFLEWSMNSNNPIEMPSGAAVANSQKDNS